MINTANGKSSSVPTKPATKNSAPFGVAASAPTRSSRITSSKTENCLRRLQPMHRRPDPLGQRQTDRDLTGEARQREIVLRDLVTRGHLAARRDPLRQG